MSESKLILAVETSCDETAAAILQGTGDLRGSVVSSQADIHAAYGGVVPEVASRGHLTAIRHVIEDVLKRAKLTLQDVDVFAATIGPGLASALLVGASAAKGLALALGKPFLGVNHIEGHLLSPFFGREKIPEAIGLVVSGGHTLLVDIQGAGNYRLLGRTLDDAAGEAFDKVAKLIGLGYPGGPEIEKHARAGDPSRFNFPRSMMHSGDWNFSFSGLKTSVRYALSDLDDGDRNDLCAGFQEAVVDVLVSKTLDAAKACHRRLIAVSGGVGLNARLRESLEIAASRAGIDVIVAGKDLCTDNAAMIAYTAAQGLQIGRKTPFDTDIFPSLGEEMFQKA